MLPDASEGGLAQYQAHPSDESTEVEPRPQIEIARYQKFIKHGRPYLCSFPRVDAKSENDTSHASLSTEHEHELERALAKGWELLGDMKEGPCLYYKSGWWSYAFCYNSQVKQFHALDPGNGVPIWPPQEDPNTPAYVLGKFKKGNKHDRNQMDIPRPGLEAGALQTRSDGRYLVQHLADGTTCDLTNRGRKVEVQFHCSQQPPDRIAWIKEIATCSYLMVVHTTRLCNDIAFLPPKEAKAHVITCQEIVRPDEEEEWKAQKSAEASRKLINTGGDGKLYAGGIEIGAQKWVGRNGRRIERGKIVMTPEEKAQTVVMQQDGKIQQLSREDLKKLELDPKMIEKFMEEIKAHASKKDWKIELIEGNDGVGVLRGVVDDDPEEEQQQNQAPAGGGTKQAEGSQDGEGEAGSQEEYYREEL